MDGRVWVWVWVGERVSGWRRHCPQGAHTVWRRSAGSSKAHTICMVCRVCSLPRLLPEELLLPLLNSPSQRLQRRGGVREARLLRVELARQRRLESPPRALCALLLPNRRRLRWRRRRQLRLLDYLAAQPGVLLLELPDAPLRRMQLQLRLLQWPNGRVRRRKLHGKLPGATLGCSTQLPEVQRTAEAQAVVAEPQADGAALEEDLPQVECPLVAAPLADERHEAGRLRSGPAVGTCGRAAAAVGGGADEAG